MSSRSGGSCGRRPSVFEQYTLDQGLRMNVKVNICGITNLADGMEP
jgi:hypothetical protein